MCKNANSIKIYFVIQSLCSILSFLSYEIKIESDTNYSTQSMR